MPRGFGIGSLYFTLESLVPESDDPLGELQTLGDDYWSQVEAALAAIPSVRNLEISERRGWRMPFAPGAYFPPRESSQGDRSPHLIHEGGPLWPHPSGMAMHFTVEVPTKVHERLLLAPSVLPAETYEVVTSFDGPYPVTIVSAPYASTACRASWGLVLVREFLAEELASRASVTGGVRLGMVAPSPFWLDGWTRPEIGLAGYRAHIDRVEGQYSELVVEFDPDEMTDDEALSHFLQDYDTEFGFFYRACSDDRAEQRLWEEVGEQLEELVELYSAEGWRAVANRRWKGGREIRRAGLAVLLAKSVSERRQVALRRAVDEMYRETEVPPLIRDRIEAELLDVTESEIGGAADIVGLLHSRQSVEAQTVGLAAGSIIGLAAGAVLSAAF